MKIISSTSRIVEATVHGSDDYNIRIKFNNGEIKSMACDCYYYMHENNCKHLATVFHYLDNNNELLDHDDVENILKSVK